MIDTRTLVDDALLRQLSLETKKIGTRVLVKRSPDQIEYSADVLDVIILPHSDFYRTKFMLYYDLCNCNSVKALKELNRHFPFIPDFELGIGYVLNIKTSDVTDPYRVKIAKELEFIPPALTASNIYQNQNIL